MSPMGNKIPDLALGHTPRSSCPRGKNAVMWLLALPAPDRLTPLVLYAFEEDSGVSWCRRKAPICSQTPVTWQASHTEATICANNSYPSTVQCQPYSIPEWARTERRWIWGQSLSVKSELLGQSISEQMNSTLKEERLTARPSTANRWPRMSRLGHFQAWCNPHDTFWPFLFKGSFEFWIYYFPL